MNGKPNDHPLTDILVYNITVFSPEIDSLIKEIVALGGQRDLETRFNLFVPPPLDEFERDLRDMLKRLKEEAKERGWEVE